MATVLKRTGYRLTSRFLQNLTIKGRFVIEEVKFCEVEAITDTRRAGRAEPQGSGRRRVGKIWTADKAVGAPRQKMKLPNLQFA